MSNVIGCVYYLKSGHLKDDRPFTCNNPQLFMSQKTVAGYVLNMVGEDCIGLDCFPAHCCSAEGQSYLLPLPRFFEGQCCFPRTGYGVGAVRATSSIVPHFWYEFPREGETPCPPLMVSAPASSTLHSAYRVVIDEKADSVEIYDKLAKISFCVKNEQEVEWGFVEISHLVEELRSDSKRENTSILLDKKISAQLERFEELVSFLGGGYSSSHPVVQRARAREKSYLAVKEEWARGGEEQQGIEKGAQMQTLQEAVEESVQQLAQTKSPVKVQVKAHWYLASVEGCRIVSDWVHVVVMDFDRSNEALSQRMSALNIGDSLPVGGSDRLLMLNIPPEGLSAPWWRSVLGSLCLLGKERGVSKHLDELIEGGTASFNDLVCSFFVPLPERILKGGLDVKGEVAEFGKARGRREEKKKVGSKKKKKEQRVTTDVEAVGEQSASGPSTGSASGQAVVGGGREKIPPAVFEDIRAMSMKQLNKKR